MTDWIAKIGRVEELAAPDPQDGLVTIDVSDVAAIDAELRGAGGGSAENNAGTQDSGGSGGYISARVDVSDASTVSVQAPEAGSQTPPTGGTGYFDGGDGGELNSSSSAGGGGGSGILRVDGVDVLAVDGGGGGALEAFDDQYVGGGGARGGVGFQDGGGVGFGGDGATFEGEGGEDGGQEVLVSARVSDVTTNTGGGSAQNIDGSVTVTSAQTTLESVYDVAPVVDTANPFGDYAVIKADDRGGQLFEQLSRGTRIDLQVVSDSVTIKRFTGYVVERRENEQQGADALEVEAYSFDQFLRRNTVTNDQTGNTITEALADIIQTDTPVTYNAANVDVGDDQELTRTYQGERVENVLRDLAFKSNNEDFGVNDDLEFFFRERETTHIDRGIDNTEWFRYDIPELGKEAINEVEVWFDDGEESVIVDDGTDKLDLQDNLGLPDPGTQRAELNRPLITDIADAEDIGRKYLTFRNATLSGTVTTFGLYDAEPGDTIDITIDSRGIDGEFVIAAVEYRWGVDETILTIVEKRGDVDDILSELNDSVQRVEMNGANRDAPKNRITTTNASAVVSVNVDAAGTAADADRVVNDGRRAMRDTWTGDAPPDITTLVVGSDGSGLSRSNTSLRNQTNSATVSQALPDATSVEFTASITQTGVQEMGLEAADGTLITRATFDSPTDIDGTVTVTLDVSNDASVSRGVLTTNGQTAVRDVLADNSPTLPNAYAYGDDGTAVAESDTALGNELVNVSLDEIRIQDSNTRQEWLTITDVADTTPIYLSDGGELALAQSAFTFENVVQRRVENENVGLFAGRDDPEWTNEQAVSFLDAGFIEWQFENNYTIPAEEFELAFRAQGEGAGTPFVTISVDGETLGDFNAGSTDIVWNQPIQLGGTLATPDSDIQPGTHTVRFEVTANSTGNDEFIVGCVSPNDSRYNYTYDNAVNEPNGHLDGPEWYPPNVTVALNEAVTRRNVTEASFTSSWNDTTSDQYIELANDGSNYTRFDNSENGSVTFASGERGVDVNLNFDRFSDQTGTTPLNGNAGQKLTDWDLFANPDAVVPDNIGETLTRAVVPPETLAAGTTLREAGLKSDSTLLTRHILASFDVLADQRIASAETSLFTSDN